MYIVVMLFVFSTSGRQPKQEIWMQQRIPRNSIEWNQIISLTDGFYLFFNTEEILTLASLWIENLDVSRPEHTGDCLCNRSA